MCNDKTKTIMKIIFSIFLLSIVSFSFSQAPPLVSICIGDSVTVCPGQPVKITNCTPGAGNPGPATINMPNPTSLSLSDDVWSGVVPIGFPFSFYGNTYSNLIIGSNGLLSFNTGSAGNYCAWSLNNTPLPTNSYPAALNSIMIAYQDILPSLTGGTIQYQTIGTAPNRKFVVLYSNVYFFSCTNVCNYYGVVLNEGTNEIEMHIGNKPSCAAFNGGRAVQGVQNAAGTVASITAGRNSGVWIANQDSRKFTPTSPTNTSNYSISVIPYNQITGVGGITSWVNTLGQSFPYNGGVLNVPNPPAGTTGYFLSGTACGASLGSISDTTWISTSAISGTITKTPDFCSSSSGSATVTAIGDGPFTYSWMPSGQTGATAINLPAGVQTLTITNANGCIKNLSAIIQNSTISTSATSTLVSCPGGNDGTATAAVNPPNPGTTYNWFDDGGQTTATATGLAAGIHRCEVISGTGCIDTLSVTITEIPGMVATSILTDVTCNSGSDGIATLTVAQGTGPYSYNWDQSISTSNVATDLVAGLHTVTITDANGCVITTTVDIDQPNPLTIVDITADMTICAEDSATISASAMGGSSAYTYTWRQGGTVVGVGQSIKVKAPTSGTQYCVEVTEVCGSPAADTCMTITFPTNLIPNIVPDMAAKCEPGVFTFSNLTNDPSEIFTTRISFGNGANDTILQGNSSITMAYPNPGVYNVDVLITSIHGCEYAKSFPAIVRTIKTPTASFTTSANPATIFETTIQMQDNSSTGIVDWQWSSPGASPSYSDHANPVFKYPEGEVGTYPIQLIVRTAEGCIDTLDAEINIVSDIIFYAPNAFTPDGNEFNQTWKVVTGGIDIYDFEVRVFNRWGEQIWESHNPAEGWDGTFQGEIIKEGSYIYVAKVKDLYSDAYKTYNGHITLIR